MNNLEFLTNHGFELKTNLFYNSRGRTDEGWYDNFVDKLIGYTKLVKHHMGGNYGLASQYIVINEDAIHDMQYYGDSSAKITVIHKADSPEYISYLQNIENDKSNL